MKKRVKIMNIKWMSLVAAITVFSAGCSDSEQESTNKQVSDTAESAGIEIKSVDITEVEGVIERPRTAEQEMKIKEALSSVEGIPPGKLDSEVKGLVAKISENSEMTKEEAVKLEQDLKSVFQKIEADRTQ